ncbi:MAG: DUF433 domain-containing protein [Chloroflexota bacterium]|nr:DUF433 domain-containing protein [Chloroflexota bacterium]
MTSLALRWGAETEPAVWQTDSCDFSADVGPIEASFNVSRTPQVWSGIAVLAGTRIPVFMIEDMYNEGTDIQTILDYYPNLSEGQIYSALAYAETAEGLVAEDRTAYEAAARMYGV